MYLDRFIQAGVRFMKKGLNSDGQQFHQYQQNEQLPFICNHWTQEKTTTYVSVCVLLSIIEYQQYSQYCKT
jgi:hypothetical protein